VNARVPSLAALLLAACATPRFTADQIFTPNQIQQRAQELDGKTVAVRGWLPFCEPSACTLFETKDAWDNFQLNTTTMLSIARDARFDASVRSRIPAEVVIRARVHAVCIDPEINKSRGSDQFLECIGH